MSIANKGRSKRNSHGYNYTNNPKGEAHNNGPKGEHNISPKGNNLNQSKGILPKGTTLAENGTATNLNKQSSAKNLPQTGENESKLDLSA
ncbi:hypothetical protein FC57_GL001379 [Lactobacillus ultunensis DSM 16047]|nr:hypothetical protein FC57_GL001379 [Lactobacillus ultunensis DSM 16047]